MVRKIFNIFVSCLLLQSTFGENDLKNIEKSVAKRGIHFNINGHHHLPHITPHVHHVAPPPHVHFVPKIPIFHKPIVPSYPYHIHHGGATVTSYNVNYPKYPYVPKTLVLPHHHQLVVPNVHSIVPHHHVVPHVNSILPHHHHSVFPHVHVAKPIVPVAVPIPGIRVLKYPAYLPPKADCVHSKPTFVPIPVPAESPQPSAGLYNQGSENKITTETLLPTYNYHAQNLFNDIERKMTKKIKVSGQGQQLAQYLLQHQSQQYQEPQNSYPYPAAETFAQNYDPPSNNGNYHGLSSYQVE